MIHTVNKGVKMGDQLKEFTVNTATYKAVSASKEVDKSTGTNVCLGFWPVTKLYDNNGFGIFHVTNGLISKLEA